MISLVGKLPAHPTRSYLTRSPGLVLNTVFHHTGVDVDNTLEEVAQYHVGTLGWPGIGYRWLVRQNGTAYECQPIEIVSYHCGSGSPKIINGIGSNNWISLGICFTGIDPTEAQVATMKWLADEEDKWFGYKLNRLPHSALSPTPCPGDTWEQWKEYIIPTPEVPV